MMATFIFPGGPVRFTRISLVLIASLAAACSSDGGGTAPAPVIVAPTISTPNTMIYIGQSVQFSATGGGTIHWGGDAPHVATVDQTTGRVTGVGTGRVTIWAENEGGRTTRLLRGLPSYAGSWRGNYTIQDCQSIGDFAAGGFCGSFFRGQSLNTRYELSQTDDRVTGTFALGDLTGTFNPSTVAENGQLPMTGGLSSGGTSVTIENLRFESATPGVITGQFEQLWGFSGLSGWGRIYCRIETVTRTAGGPSFGFTAPSSAEPLSLEEMIRRVLRR